jgi:hypothetical protein
MIPLGKASQEAPQALADNPPAIRKLSDLEEELERVQKRNNVLDKLVAEYRRIYGNDYGKYPNKEVAVQARTLELETQDALRRRNRELADNQQVFRRRSHSPTRSDKNRPRPIDPNPYKGKSPKELAEYLQTCNRTFDYNIRGFRIDKDKITWAATFLRKEPANSWERFRKNEPYALDTMI